LSSKLHIVTYSGNHFQLRDGIHLQSNTFQLIRAAFDDEVTAEDVENFRRKIQIIRSPENISQFFAFRGNHSTQASSFLIESSLNGVL